MTVDRIEDFQALEPFFRVIEDGLAGLVDGGHFFDLHPERAALADGKQTVTGKDSSNRMFRMDRSPRAAATAGKDA